MSVGTGTRDDDVMATINITPFTDVLLVLLIIFIILTSVSRDQHLPDAKNTTKLQQSQLVVTVDHLDHVAIGARGVTVAEMPGGLFANSRSRRGTRYYKRYH